MDISRIIIFTLIAFIVTSVLMPLVRKLSVKIGNIDTPKKDVRKLASHAVPNGAGLAIFAGFLVASLATGNLSPDVIGLLVAGFVLLLFGFIDELYDVPSVVQFLGQILASIIVIVSGVRIDVIGNFGAGNDGLYFLESLSIPFTLLWIIGVTNAIRVLDGIDGLCAGVTGIIAWTMGVVALMTGRTEPAILGFILGAVAFAYLPSNFSKDKDRKIFMAESGSSFIGFTLAVVAIMGSAKTATTFSMLVPIIALIYPIFDIAFAFGRRILAGKSPFKADGMHLHHRLIKKGLNHKQATLVFYVATAILGILAVCSTKMDERSVIYVFLTTLLAFIILLWKFGLITITRPNNK